MPGYLYSEAGVWAATDETQQIVRLGLSDYRQQSSGDVAFFNAPATGRRVSQGDELASIETVKVDLEVPSPLTGEIVAANEALEDTPELINQDPLRPRLAGGAATGSMAAGRPAGRCAVPDGDDCVQAEAEAAA